MSEYFNPEVAQTYDNTCAIKSQQLILQDFGIEISEDALVQISAENGWYTGHGTAPQDVGKLLELANIPCVQQQNANVFNLVNELAQGHKVIVGLDSDELWKNDTISQKFKNWIDDYTSIEEGDHALIVAGIDTSDPNDIQVIVQDPGTGDDGKPYPLDQFMDAWSDAHCFMVSTEVPAHPYADGMMNFDQEMGHIPEVGGVPYHEFEIFNDISMGLPNYVPFNNGFISPMPSLVDSYFDYANNGMPFIDVFSDNYLFNDFMDCNVINDYMRPTFIDGFNDISWNSLPPMNYDIPMNFTPMTLADMNIDCNQFYNDCMNQFSLMNDLNSMALCQQQLDIMGYCDCNDMNYYNDFLMFM